MRPGDSTGHNKDATYLGFGMYVSLLEGGGVKKPSYDKSTYIKWVYALRGKIMFTPAAALEFHHKIEDRLAEEKQGSKTRLATESIHKTTATKSSRMQEETAVSKATDVKSNDRLTQTRSSPRFYRLPYRSCSSPYLTVREFNRIRRVVRRQQGTYSPRPWR